MPTENHNFEGTYSGMQMGIQWEKANICVDKEQFFTEVGDKYAGV